MAERVTRSRIRANSSDSRPNTPTLLDSKTVSKNLRKKTENNSRSNTPISEIDVKSNDEPVALRTRGVSKSPSTEIFEDKNKCNEETPNEKLLTPRRRLTRRSSLLLVDTSSPLSPARCTRRRSISATEESPVPRRTRATSKSPTNIEIDADDKKIDKISERVSPLKKLKIELRPIEEELNESVKEDKRASSKSPETTQIGKEIEENVSLLKNTETGEELNKSNGKKDEATKEASNLISSVTRVTRASTKSPKTTQIGKEIEENVSLLKNTETEEELNKSSGKKDEATKEASSYDLISSITRVTRASSKSPKTTQIGKEIEENVSLLKNTGTEEELNKSSGKKDEATKEASNLISSVTRVTRASTKSPKTTQIGKEIEENVSLLKNTGTEEELNKSSGKNDEATKEASSYDLISSVARVTRASSKSPKTTQIEKKEIEENVSLLKSTGTEEELNKSESTNTNESYDINISTDVSESTIDGNDEHNEDKTNKINLSAKIIQMASNNEKSITPLQKKIMISDSMKSSTPIIDSGEKLLNDDGKERKHSVTIQLSDITNKSSNFPKTPIPNKNKNSMECEDLSPVASSSASESECLGFAVTPLSKTKNSLSSLSTNSLKITKETSQHQQEQQIDNAEESPLGSTPIISKKLRKFVINNSNESSLSSSINIPETYPFENSSSKDGKEVNVAKDENVNESKKILKNCGTSKQEDTKKQDSAENSKELDEVLDKLEEFLEKSQEIPEKAERILEKSVETPEERKEISEKSKVIPETLKKIQEETKKTLEDSKDTLENVKEISEKLMKTSEVENVVEDIHNASVLKEKSIDNVTRDSKNLSKTNISCLSNKSESMKNENISFAKSWDQSIKSQSEKIDSFGVKEKEKVINNEKQKSLENYDKNEVEEYGSEKTDDDDDDDEEENKNEFLDDEAKEVDDDSNDSMDSSEREYLKQNELPEYGEDLGSEDTDEDEDVENDETDNDSFIVSHSEEEDNGLESDINESCEDLDVKKSSKITKINEEKISDGELSSENVTKRKKRNYFDSSSSNSEHDEQNELKPSKISNDENTKNTPISKETLTENKQSESFNNKPSNASSNSEEEETFIKNKKSEEIFSTEEEEEEKGQQLQQQDHQNNLSDELPKSKQNPKENEKSEQNEPAEGFSKSDENSRDSEDINKIGTKIVEKEQLENHENLSTDEDDQDENNEEEIVEVPSCKSSYQAALSELDKRSSKASDKRENEDQKSTAKVQKKLKKSIFFDENSWTEKGEKLSNKNIKRKGQKPEEEPLRKRPKISQYEKEQRKFVEATSGKFNVINPSPDKQMTTSGVFYILNKPHHIETKIKTKSGFFNVTNLDEKKTKNNLGHASIKYPWSTAIEKSVPTKTNENFQMSINKKIEAILPKSIQIKREKNKKKKLHFKEPPYSFIVPKCSKAKETGKNLPDIPSTSSGIIHIENTGSTRFIFKSLEQESNFTGVNENVVNFKKQALINSPNVKRISAREIINHKKKYLNNKKF